MATLRRITRTRPLDVLPPFRPLPWPLSQIWSWRGHIRQKHMDGTVELIGADRARSGGNANGNQAFSTPTPVGAPEILRMPLDIHRCDCRGWPFGIHHLHARASPSAQTIPIQKDPTLRQRKTPLGIVTICDCEIINRFQNKLYSNRRVPRKN